MVEKYFRETVLITGCARRLGRHIALALAREGMDVIIHFNRSRDDALCLAREIKGMGGGAYLVEGDLSSPGEIEKVMRESLRVSKNLKVLVNNASVFFESTVHNLDYSAFEHEIRVNAWAPFALARSFYEKVGEGCIINILDSRIKSQDKEHAGYIWSKKLLNEITRTLAIEFAPKVRVNGVAPGAILPPEGRGEDYVEKISESCPLKRWGSPENIAHAVLFLIRNDYITGQVIYVDGGRHLLR